LLKSGDDGVGNGHMLFINWFRREVSAR
jgi:hypothetical protein